MKKLVLAAALAGSMVFAAAPAQAIVILAGTQGNIFTPFAAIAATQGTQIAFTSVTGSALTFNATMNAAVYRNDLGTLDFYYQVFHNGAGSTGSNDEITGFTAANFNGFLVDGYVAGLDPDSGGPFVAVNNGTPAIGSTTTVGRSPSGNVIETDFHGAGSGFNVNGLIEGENSATYIFRTNAESFQVGTFGVIDGSTLQGLAFAPGGIPEPATWLMMIGGFGMVGAAMRRRRSRAKIAFA
ncbi:MAG TPA: PEPxxWA-CTERM sorting domain-containing protein [Allosphingosinicella sp.]|jgi:hypothetical protein